MLLKDKVAIITGAASARGLGFATAKLFAENGASVVIIDLNGEASKAAAAALGEGHLGLAANVADEVQVQAAERRVSGRVALRLRRRLTDDLRRRGLPVTRVSLPPRALGERVVAVLSAPDHAVVLRHRRHAHRRLRPLARRGRRPVRRGLFQQ